MKWTPSSSSRSAMRSLSCTERLTPLHLRTVAQRRVVQRYARHETLLRSIVPAASSFLRRQEPRANVQQKTRPCQGRASPAVPPFFPLYPSSPSNGQWGRSAERHHAPAFGNGRRTRSGLLTRSASLRLTAREGSSTGAAHRSHTVTGSLDRRGARLLVSVDAVTRNDTTSAQRPASAFVCGCRERRKGPGGRRSAVRAGSHYRGHRGRKLYVGESQGSPPALSDEPDDGEQQRRLQEEHQRLRGES